MITTLAIENYRSLRRLVLRLGPSTSSGTERSGSAGSGNGRTSLTVVTGANGTGKSSVYRSLRMLAEASRNGAVAALAREGGLPSTLWAGPENIARAVREGEHPVQGTRRKDPIALRLGFAGDEFGYAIDFGLPIPSVRTMFGIDPEIKAESVWSGPILRPATLLTERRSGSVRIRDLDGEWSHHEIAIRPYDSMLSEIADPRLAPELLAIREQIRSWRFYDQFRTDGAAPARLAQVGTRTPVLSQDGHDLAAALQTIRELGPSDVIDVAISRAFPGSSIDIINRDGWFDIAMRQHGLLRPLASAELSDGTLRYLLWVAALLSPRPPQFLVLNEPETSLHPELIAPLAGLIAAAAAESQVLVVTHSAPLIAALQPADPTMIELVKDFGETRIAGQDAFDGPSWIWPKR